MISEVLIFLCKTFDFFVFCGSKAECGLRNLGCQYRIVFFFSYTALFLFIRKILADSNSSDSLVYPVFGISFLLIQHFHALLGQFRIFYLQYTLISDLGQPQFKWFCFGEWTVLAGIIL